MAVLAYITCDFRDMDAPAGKRLCDAREVGYNIARARKVAREAGWLLGVGKSRYNPGKDYCPKHKSEES